MFRGLLSFYWECLKRALSGKFWRVERWTGGISLLGLAVTYFWHQSPDLNAMINTAIPVWFFLAVLLGTIAFHLIVTPYLLYDEERQRANLLANRQEPRLPVSLEGEEAVWFHSGTTSETYGGDRFSVATSSNRFVSLICENQGLDTCSLTAKIMAGWRKGENGDMESIHLPETVPLSWSADARSPSFHEGLDANERKRVYVATLGPKGQVWLYREITGLPFEQQQLFGTAGTYQLLIQFKGDQPAPYHVLLQLETWMDDSAATKAVMGRSKCKVTIVAQGAPPLINEAPTQTIAA